MKHQGAQFRILSQTSNGYIGVCDCCREFNFVYKNVLLSFQEEEMIRFFDWLMVNAKSPEHYMPLPHGRTRIFSSPNSNLFLTYHDNELEEISRIYNETQLLLQAQKVLLSNRMN